MDRWPRLKELSLYVQEFLDVDMWLFGSMLHSRSPRDLDVLLIYKDIHDIECINRMSIWELSAPAIEIIAMTMDEEVHYKFIETTRALRVQDQDH